MKAVLLKMGVKDFFKIKFGDRTIKDIGKYVNLSDISGITVAVDASIMIYRAVLAHSNLESLTNEEGEMTIHINSIFNSIIQLAKAGIDQIWVFDNPKPTEMKARILKARAEKRSNAVGKHQFKLTSKEVKHIQELLTYMGIMYITSPPGIEAEQYAAALTKGKDKFCSYVLSWDSDILMFGGNLLRLPVPSSKGPDKKMYTIFEIDTVLETMEITYDQLLIIGVSLGTDLNEKTPRAGPASIVKKVKNKEYGLNLRQEKVIKYFKSAVTDEIIHSAEKAEEEYNRDKVLEFLNRFDFNEQLAIKKLDVYENSKFVEDQ